MPGNIVLDASSFCSSRGSSRGEGLTLAPTDGLSSATSYRASSDSLGGSAPGRPKLAFDVRQPSFGPGSPEAPIHEIARAVKSRSIPQDGSASSKVPAIGRFSFDSRHEEAANIKSEISRGRKDAMTDGEIVGPFAEDVSRGSRSWTSDGGGKGAGEWEGGDSDEDSSDEEDDELVLHP